MENNKICVIIGIVGALVVMGSLDLMLFGFSSAFWGAVVGLLACSFSFYEYE